jgi:TolB-like protein/Tfp pilus assembly protein PilF
MNLGNFFSELQRRNVYKVAVAYLVGGWALAQGIAQVFPVFDVPNWVIRLIVLVIIIGFPIALVLAWVFELTPQGLKRTHEVDPAAAGRTRSRGWIYVVIIGGIFSAGLFLLGRYSAPSRQNESTAAAVPSKSIAVLPFENLSDDKSTAYFADGVQDEILTKLAGIGDLKVISRTSTEKYKSKPEDLKTVSTQLGVATVLEGSVQKAGDKVRVNVQLIDARADAHLWAKSYDRDLKDVFAVESEVAGQIADALKAKLSPEEANKVAAAPTQDPAAYDLFLKAEHEELLAESSLKPESFDQAAAWYRQAIERDPNFALAFARLVECRLQRHWFVETASESQLAEIRALAEHAIVLAPNLAAAYAALGIYYYMGHRQYGPALVEFQRAIELQPNNARAIEFSGYVHRRQGDWQRSLAELHKALDYDPRNATLFANIASTYVHLRMWKEGAQSGQQCLAIDAHDVVGMRAVLLSCFNANGDLKEGRRLLSTFPADSKIVSNSVRGSIASLIGERASALILEHDFPAALKLWDGTANDPADQRRQLSARAAIRVLAGDLSGAQADAKSARPLVEARLREQPDDVLAHSQMSWVELAENHNPEALQHAQRAADLFTPEIDTLAGTFTLTGLAEIQARVGATADAVKTIQRLLDIPAGDAVSIARLKIDPVWDPIRSDPAFQRLLTGPELIGPGK